MLASSNPGKAREIGALVAGLGLTITPQSELGVPAVEEHGRSFRENAILKARNAAAHTGLPAIGDDSGLEVDALKGAPGIHSARYAGTDATDAANIDKLLRALADIPRERRGARFQCVMVYLRGPEDPNPLLAEGTWEGEILTTPRGQGGFGYDPVFFVPTHGCSAAELPAEVKNRLSHRAQALRKLLTVLAAQRP